LQTAKSGAYFHSYLQVPCTIRGRGLVWAFCLSVPVFFETSAKIKKRKKAKEFFKKNIPVKAVLLQQRIKMAHISENVKTIHRNINIIMKEKGTKNFSEMKRYLVVIL